MSKLCAGVLTLTINVTGSLYYYYYYYYYYYELVITIMMMLVVVVVMQIVNYNYQSRLDTKAYPEHQ